jgi:hypothetical protein
MDSQVRSPGYAPPRQVSVEEYLRLEAAAEERHEYWHGWMYPRMYPPGSHLDAYTALPGLREFVLFDTRRVNWSLRRSASVYRSPSCIEVSRWHHWWTTTPRRER